MPEITMLSEAHLRGLVPLDLGAIACVEEAFRALATQPVVMPPIRRLDLKDAVVALAAAHWSISSPPREKRFCSWNAVATCRVKKTTGIPAP